MCEDLGYNIAETKRWIVNICMSSGQSIVQVADVGAYVEVSLVTISDATITEGIFACINP